MRKPSRRTVVIIIAAALALILIALVTTLVITGRPQPQTTATPGVAITNPANIGSSLPTPTATPTPAASTPQVTITATPQVPNVNIQPTTPKQYDTPDLALATTQASIGYLQYCTYTKGTTAAAHKTAMKAFYTANSPKLDDYNNGIATQTCTPLSTTTTGSYKNGAINVHMIQHVDTAYKNGTKKSTSYTIDTQMVYDKTTNTFHIQDFVQQQEKK